MYKVNNKATKNDANGVVFGGFIVNFVHISYLCSTVSIVNFEQVNAIWVIVFYILTRRRYFFDCLSMLYFSRMHPVCSTPSRAVEALLMSSFVS